MYLKLLGACVAVVAWAAIAIAPGMASAAPVLYSGETKVSLGTEVMATAGRVVFTNSSGDAMFQCTSSKMTGNVVGNDSSSGVSISVNSGVFKGTAVAEKCQVGFESVGITFDSPMCLKSVVSGTGWWNLYGGSCPSSAAVSFTYVGSVAGTCHYSRSRMDLTDSSPSTEPLLMQTNPTAYSLTSGGNLCPSALGISTTYELKTTSGANLKTL
jgi:hypothetical protein